MDLQEYRKDLIEEVKASAEVTRDFEVSAFVNVTTRLLSDAGEIADFEQCHFRGTGSRKRNLAVDGFAFDNTDGSVRIVIADWDGTEEISTLTQTDAKSALGRARAFVEESITSRYYESLENSTEAYALARELHQRREGLTRCRVYLVTDKALSGRARDFPEGRVESVPVEFHIWDVARFQRVSESESGRDEIEIDFSARTQGGIPCLAASLESDEYKAYLCVIRGDVLANIYDEFGSRVLEGNVRSFLSVKGKINKGIRATIRAEPEMFFAYNNGIAATASEALVKPNRNGHGLVRVKDLQIVNGGQTTASLAMALREGGASLSSIFVQMKLSVIPPERAGDVIPRIAKYANSQNKVSEADFFSNHDFHRRLETLSRQAWAPAVGGAQHETHWFYERARGQFAHEQARMTKSEKKRFLLQNPKQQLIVKTDVAKFENAWRQLPHIVCLGAQKNFLHFAEVIQAEWEQGDSQFNRDYFTTTVAKAILYMEAERTVSAQPWYQGGYRAQVVAYTIAKLSQLISTSGLGKELDFGAIWARQSVTDAVRLDLVRIATAVHEVLVSPDAGHANVTEWCKREQCWRRVEAVKLPLGSGLVSALVDRDAARTRRKEAKKGQVEDSKITNVMSVVDLGDRYWSKLKAWGDARAFWTEEEARLLVLAGRRNFVPFDRQAVRLMALRERATEEGFVSG